MRASVGVCSCPDALPSRHSHVNQVPHILSLVELPLFEPGAVHGTTRLHCRLARPPPQLAHTGLSCSLRYSFPARSKVPRFLVLPASDKLRQFSAKLRGIPAHPATSPAQPRLLTTLGAGRYPESLSIRPAPVRVALLPVRGGFRGGGDFTME